MALRDCFCGDETCHLDREKKMVLDKERGFHCDPCIAEIVAALNVAGMKTVASCCGHGWRPGNIALADGREVIIARDYEEARKVDRLFPVDVNGNSCQAKSPDGAVAWGVRVESGFFYLTDLPAQAERWRKDGHNAEPLVSATAAQAKIERLTRERDELELDLKAIFDQSEIKAAMHMARTATERRIAAETELATLRTRNAELVEGLRPFAEVLSRYDFDSDDIIEMLNKLWGRVAVMRAAHFIRARNLMEQNDGK